MSNLNKYEKLLYKHNRLKRHCGNQMNKITELKQELQRKDNNWNELKEWLDNRSEFTNMGAVLDKIKELEVKTKPLKYSMDDQVDY